MRIMKIDNTIRDIINIDIQVMDGTLPKWMGSICDFILEHNNVIHLPKFNNKEFNKFWKNRD